MPYQAKFEQYGVDYYHLSGLVDAECSVPPVGALGGLLGAAGQLGGGRGGYTPSDSLLYGYGSIAIISDGVMSTHPHLQPPVAFGGQGNYGQALNFSEANGDGETEGKRGTIMAGIIGGATNSPSVGIAPNTSQIYDYPIFRQSIKNAILTTDAGQHHTESVNALMAGPDYLIHAIDDAVSKGVQVIIIDINYNLFQLTDSVVDGDNSFENLKTSIISAAAAQCVIILNVGDVAVEDDDYTASPEGPYRLLDSIIPEIRPYVFQVRGIHTTYDLIGNNPYYRDLNLFQGNPELMPGGYGNQRMIRYGFVSPVDLDRYKTDGTIDHAQKEYGNHAAAAFFAGFIQLINGIPSFAQRGANYIACSAYYARAAMYYFASEFNPSSDTCGNFTGDGQRDYVEQQIYPRGWNKLSGFGAPSFEILQRIVSNAARGCSMLGQTVTKTGHDIAFCAVPSLTSDFADELLPERFQSTRATNTVVNTFFLLDLAGSWPDTGPPRFCPPTDVDFVERVCPL